MKEAYLHYIWKTKSFQSFDLKTVEGEAIQIINYGLFNSNQSGPDFLFAKIQIGMLVHYGHVEIHVNALEWFAHRHHNDPAFDNVILHVVLNDNSDGRIGIPTLELKNRLNYTTYMQWVKMSASNTTYPCSYAQEHIPEVIQQSTLFNAFINRLERKQQEYQQKYGAITGEQLLAVLCSKSLGNLTNGEAFANEIFRSGDRVISENFICKMPVVTKGVRPHSQPQKRLTQLRWLFDHWHWMQIEFSMIDDYKLFRKVWMKKINEGAPIPFTNFVVDQLFINCILPVFYWESILDESEKKRQAVIQLFSQIPPERNKFTDKWTKEMFPLDSAIDSQGVLELTRFYCERKQCLNCAIGHKSLQL